MIKRGDMVKIAPEWRDPGNERLVWVAVEDQDGERVRIAPLSTGLAYPINQVVRTSMLVHE